MTHIGVCGRLEMRPGINKSAHASSRDGLSEVVLSQIWSKILWCVRRMATVNVNSIILSFRFVASDKFNSINVESG